MYGTWLLTEELEVSPMARAVEFYTHIKILNMEEISIKPLITMI